MDDDRTYWLAIALWIFDGALVIGILTPTHYYTTAYHCATEYTQQHYDAHSEFALAVFSASFWEAAATIVIAIFTIVLACVTRRQARLSRESIDLARHEFISTHRPKIIVRNASTTGSVSTTGFVVGAPITICFTYINIGETIANITAAEACVFLRPKDSPIPEGLQFRKCEITKPALSCGEFSVGKIDSNFPVEARDIENLQRGGKIICVIGRIEYLDGRGSLRRMGFARQCCHISELRFTFTPIDDEEYEYAY
jgi:hypothetical protein